ncbi:TRAM domain-containing protein [archaeon]|nr:MAG: TRAM domain-containing protein [archaeon]
MRFERRGGSFGGGSGGRRFGGGGSRGGFESRDEPKPVKVGEEYDVEISEVGSKGDGIARIKNFVVFVNGVKQGEKARIKITDVRNRFAIGEKAGAAGEAPAAEESTETTEETTESTEVTEETSEE